VHAPPGPLRQRRVAVLDATAAVAKHPVVQQQDDGEGGLLGQRIPARGLGCVFTILGQEVTIFGVAVDPSSLAVPAGTAYTAQAGWRRSRRNSIYSPEG
jgi:hypothetical protein